MCNPSLGPGANRGFFLSGIVNERRRGRLAQRAVKRRRGQCEDEGAVRNGGEEVRGHQALRVRNGLELPGTYALFGGLRRA
jgi:hypothetical protein